MRVYYKIKFLLKFGRLDSICEATLKTLNIKEEHPEDVFIFSIFFDELQILYETLASNESLRTHIKFSFEIRGGVIAAALSKSQNETLCEMLN